MASQITTIGAVQSLPGFDATPYGDDQIGMAVDAVNAQIERYCNRTFEVTDYTEKLDGNGRDTIFLSNYPIAEVTTVTLDGVEITDYEIEGTQKLYREDGWTRGRRNIVVTYTAGYTAIPSDLQFAAARMVQDLLQTNAVSGQFKSEKFDNYEYTLADNQQASIGKYSSELNGYRRWVM